MAAPPPAPATQAAPGATGAGSAAHAAPLVAALTASGGSESAGFLNDIVAQLWPNICVVGADMTKSIVEPMFASMLPSPLNSLHFAKIDLGKVPLKLGNVDVHKMDSGAIKMDLDLDWDGECDIELDGTMIPKIGIEHVKLKGRLSVLLGPLLNTMPLIGAAQVAFINPPFLKFTYTDVAKVANVGFIDSSITKIVLGIISSMAVLPNRFLVKLDAANNWFNTYQFPLGILRLNVESATNLGEDKKGKNFFKKLVHDLADSYVNVTLGETWRTKTINNDRNPKWNETHDFIVSDHDQTVSLAVMDADTTSDDTLGAATTSVKELLLKGGAHELSLVHNDAPTDGKVRIRGQFLHLVPDAASLNSQDAGTHGVLTILIASALHITGEREQLKPSVAVKWGESSFRTAVKSDAPGSDIQNPSFDVAYSVPLSASVTVNGAAPVRLILMDAEKERGYVDVPLEEVLAAPGLFLQKDFKVEGDGAVIRAAVALRGTKAAH